MPLLVILDHTTVTCSIRKLRWANSGIDYLSRGSSTDSTNYRADCLGMTTRGRAATCKRESGANLYETFAIRDQRLGWWSTQTT